MALSEKEKNEIKSRIDKRIKNERIKLSEKISSKASSEEMFNMVRQFKKVLQEDFERVYQQDNSMDNYFGEKIAEINFMEMIVYKIDPNLFIREADKLEKKVLNQMNICLNKLDNKKTIDKNLNQLMTEMYELKFFINLFKNTELMEIEIIKNKVSEVSDDIAEYDEKIKYIENNFNKNSNSSKKGEIMVVSSKINSLDLLDKYLDNLLKFKDNIIKLYPNDKFFVEGTIYFMENDLKNKYNDDERLNSLKNIKEEFINRFGFDMENNTIKNSNYGMSGSYRVNSDSNENNVDDDIVRPNVSREEFNKYMALASTINDYIDDLYNEFSNILNSTEGEYEANSEELYSCINRLRGLSEDARKVSRSYNEINDDFRNFRTYLKNRFNYEYKSKNRGRSRSVEAVKRIGLGIGGLAVGAYGFSWLIWIITIYCKCGFLFVGFKPLVIPTTISLLSIIMLNRAFSREKSMIRKLFEKIKDKKIGYNSDEYIDMEDDSNKRIKGR